MSLRSSPVISPVSLEAILYNELFGDESISSPVKQPQTPNVNSSVRYGYRDYSEIEQRVVPAFTFGGEGQEDGKLSRPWGIACDKRGRILVADRSNNRIQIFTPEGQFISKFGTFGTGPGQMNRPAGIATNSLNQIIVADKDNHRIQVFDEFGRFIFMFGSCGRAPGQFNYPWGVACNAKNEIAISDTRNHRIQIFSIYGYFLRKCTFDSTFTGKTLFSPRGLVFLPDGFLVVTDFNGHRVAVVDMNRDVTDVILYGGEGMSPGCFCRPQGVALDNAGNILVCDSRCNRVQVFGWYQMRVLSILGLDQPYKMKPMTTSASECKFALGISNYLSRLAFNSSGSESNSTAPLTPATAGFSMDRPSDVCVGHDGRIYVVDFGNNCVHVF
ncbi:Protein LTV1-like protein [Aphelenchoides besseyi]|nr:Protein LTV1-like protein [Aphelenchoides besseyi]